LTNAHTAPHEIYGIEKWGKELFSVLPSGDVGLINPFDPSNEPLNLSHVIQDLKERGIDTPIVLRVGSFLRHAIEEVHTTFGAAMRDLEYKGDYRGVFPIKVNQQSQIVDRIVTYGQKFNFGLEAGSKPELVVALAHDLPADAMVVCNGVKDAEFIRLAILSLKLGFKTVIVLESPKELDTVLEVTQELGIEPLLGVRVKLNNRIKGNWAESSGDRSTFGMNTDQLVRVLDKLRAHNMLHCLQLQHSHLGSQVPDINDVRRSVSEACRYFIELRREGVPLRYLDLGGGMGVDYTGEKRATENSINYSIQEYCESVIDTVKYALDEAQIEHPTLITESGRALVATSSILLFDVLEATLYDAPTAATLEEGDHYMMTNLAEVETYLTPKRVQECWNDAIYYRNELRALFHRGAITLRQMGRAERMYLYLVSKIKEIAEDANAPDLSEQLREVADIYHCNFSLFQSLPDAWAIDQLHPVLPIQRLNEKPTRQAVLSDITCDSDGKLDRFVLDGYISPSLPVHQLKEDEWYYLGVFFVGAYQETLGDLHNLFGDTNAVTIDFRADGGFDLLHEQEGDTIAEVLSYVEYDPADVMAAFRKVVDGAISKGTLKSKERKKIIDAYRDSLGGYTYYE
jgi:arginine decarboxylase